MCIFVDGVVYQGEASFLIVTESRELVDCYGIQDALRFSLREPRQICL